MITINNKTKLLFVLITAILGVYLGFQYILPLLIPFILAYFFAWCLLPIVRFLNYRFHLPRIVGGILSIGLLGIAIGWLICYLGNIFMHQLVILFQNMPIYLSIISGRIESFCNGCDKFFGCQVGSVREFMNSSMENMLFMVKTDIIPSLTSHSLNIAIGIIGIIGMIIIIIVSILLLIKDEDDYNKSFKSFAFYPEIHLVTKKISETGIAYLRAQGIMMIFISILCSVGLLLLKNKYALLIGVGIGIFDAFPVLGSGLILVPWSLISLMNKDLYSAAVLMSLYLGCQIVRQCLEPRLLGNRIGIKPVFTLMSMYVGIRLFGFPGFLLGPLGLVIITTITKESEKRLSLKS